MDTQNQVKILLKLHDLETDDNGIGSDEVFQEVTKDIDPSFLRNYRKIRAKKGTGIAILKDCMCSECRMIYPDTHEMLRRDNCVAICEFCGRFLIIPEKGE